METIQKKEFSVLVYFLMRSFYIGIAIYNILLLTKQDSWISIIIGFLIGLIPLLIFYALLNEEPDLNINQKIVKCYGKTLGNFINIIFICSVTFNASISLWNLSSFINSQFLFQTPIIVIAIFFMIPIIYTVYKGLKVIGRTSMVLFVTTLLLFSLAFISLTGYFELNHLFPMMESSWKNIFSASITNMTYNVLPIFPLLIISKNSIANNKKLGKSLLKIYLFSFITMFAVMFCIIAIFGSPLALLYQYPEYHLLKIINVGNFFQRVESILSLQWLFDFAISLIIFIYFVKVSCKETFKLKDKYDFVLILAIAIVIIFLSQIIFPNNTVAYQFLNHIYLYIRIALLLIIPAITLFILKWRKKKN